MQGIGFVREGSWACDLLLGPGGRGVGEGVRWGVAYELVVNGVRMFGYGSTPGVGAEGGGLEDGGAPCMVCL